MIRGKYIICLLAISLFIVEAGLMAQFRGVDSSIVEKVDSGNEPKLQEKVMISINKSSFLSGENILCSVFIRDAWLHKPLSLSNFITIELLDKKNRPVFREKYSLRNGKGAAVISIPGSLESGIYTIRAYTNWMRNTSSSYFFHRNISIIDPIRVAGTNPPEAKMPLRINFFSEGGNFVGGADNHLVVKASDNFGYPVEGIGFLLSEPGDTLGLIELNADGLGDMKFIPQYGQICKFHFKGRNWELPEIKHDGYILKAGYEGKSDGLSVDIQRIKSKQTSLSLLLFRRGMLFYSAKLPEFENNYSIEIPVNEMHGLGSLILVGEDGVILAKRLIQFSGIDPGKIDIAVEALEFKQREKVDIIISASSPYSDVSLFVELEEEAFIAEVSDSDLFYSESGFFLPMLEESKDLQLIIIGDKNEEWNNGGEESQIEFMPELRGQMISGRIVNSDSDSLKELRLVLAKISNEAEISNVNVSDEGSFYLHPKTLISDQEFVLLQKSKENHTILFDEPYSNQFVDFVRPRFLINEGMREHIERKMIRLQLQQLYNKDQVYSFRTSMKFYGTADEVIEFNEYIKLPVMEEFFRELTKFIILTREDGKLKINVLDKYRNRIIGPNPVFLLDGIPVFDAEDILNLDPEAVKRISTKASRYFYGDLIMDGIIDIETYKGDFSAVEFPENASLHLLHPSKSVPDDLYQEYCKTQELDFSPDLRTTLCWEPILETDKNGEAKLSFFTSDLPGNYIIKVMAFSKDGSFMETTRTIVVK